MITGIFGATGTGKSTLLKAIARRAPRVIVVDPLGKLGHLGRCVGGLQAFRGFWRRRFSATWRMVLQPGKIAPDLAPREALAPFVREAFNVAAHGAPPFLVAVDEADRFGSPGDPDPTLRMVADYGRNYGVSLAFVARRPACIDRTLTANADTLYAYRITEARDLEYFRDIIGAEAAGRLPTLAAFHALRWQVGRAPEIVKTFPEGGGGEKREAPAVPTGETLAAPGPAPAGQTDIAPGDPFSGECRVMTLGELAAAFGHRNATKFRRTVLDRGTVPVRRVSPRRYVVPVAALPTKD